MARLAARVSAERDPAPRPRVGAAQDTAEREADRIAAVLTASASARLGCTACADGTTPCSACAAGAAQVRRSAARSAPAAPAVAPPPVMRALTEPGTPLPEALRAKFERRLGTDLGALRLHTGPQAARAARSINAEAFALGPHIALGAAAPGPESAAGERLLAHEVAHTLEQGPLVIRRRDLGAEADARDFAKQGPTATPNATPRPPVDTYARIRDIVGTKEGEGNAWVGPLDEYELEALWGGLGDRVMTDLASGDKRTLWDRSIEKGAELHKIPAMCTLQLRFITAVAEVARGYLDQNKATAQAEKEAIGSDPNSAPTPAQNQAADERRQAAENIKRARIAQAGLRTGIHVGYDRLPGHYSLIRSECHPIANEEGNRNLVVKPFNPYMAPTVAPRGDECIPMPTYAATMAVWKKLTAVQEGQMQRFPSLYALARNLDEESIATSQEGGSTQDARTRMLAAMDKVLANIQETYPRLEGHLPYELHPIHRQLFQRPPWDAGIRGETAKALVQEYQDAEFWKSMGLAAVQMAMFVVATLATGGLAALAFGAAAGVGLGQAANSIRKWEELDSANRTNLSDDTALVSSGEVGGALFAAVLDTAFAFLDAYQAVKGVGTLARGARGVAGAAPATLEAATEAEARALAEGQAKVAEKAAPNLGKRLSTPGAARLVEDEGLRRAGYRLEVEVEHEGEKHIFRQRADGTWCRFSVRICGLSMGPEVDRAARAALREAEAPLEVAATRGAVEGVSHQAPKTLSAARIGTMIGKLGQRFPVLNALTPGAVERIVRAGFAHAEGGGLRRALRWAGAVRGQLLEEIAAVRIRGLIGTAEGRAALGLEREATDLIFIEGSRIRDAAGLQLTDGVIARRIGDRVEIVAVLESKAGAWAAGGLTESLQGIRRMGLEDIMEGVRQGGALAAVERLDPGLAGKLGVAQIAALDDAGKLALRERVLGALDRLPETDLRKLKDMMQTGEGQISRDIERLMSGNDRTVQLQIHDGSGNPVRVTAEMPKRPRFVGAVPSDVAVDDMAKALGKEGFAFGNLDLGGMAMTRDQLDALARAIIADLGTEFETTVNAAAKAGGTVAP